MTTPTIEKKIARGIELKQIIATHEAELKEIKADLTAEAEGREDEQQATEGGGWSWRHADAAGQMVCVTKPGDKLKSTINPEAKGFDKIRTAAGRAWSFLFYQVPAYNPKTDFRSLAVAHLGRDAQKLIKLVTSDSETKVSFEVAQREAV